MSKSGKLKVYSAKPEVAVVFWTLQQALVLYLDDAQLSLVVCASMCMSDTCVVVRQRSQEVKTSMLKQGSLVKDFRFLLIHMKRWSSCAKDYNG